MACLAFYALLPFAALSKPQVFLPSPLMPTPAAARSRERAAIPRMELSREQLLQNLAAYETEVKEQAKRDAAASAGLSQKVFTVASVAAAVAGGRAALVSTRLERERKQLEQQQQEADSPARRSFVGTAVTGLAGAALGSLFSRATTGGSDSRAADKSTAAAATNRKLTEAQARAEAAERRAAAAEARLKEAPKPEAPKAADGATSSAAVTTSDGGVAQPAASLLDPLVGALGLLAAGEAAALAQKSSETADAEAALGVQLNATAELGAELNATNASLIASFQEILQANAFAAAANATLQATLQASAREVEEATSAAEEMKKAAREEAEKAKREAKQTLAQAEEEASVEAARAAAALGAQVMQKLVEQSATFNGNSRVWPRLGLSKIEPQAGETAAASAARKAMASAADLVVVPEQRVAASDAASEIAAVVAVNDTLVAGKAFAVASWLFSDAPPLPPLPSPSPPPPPPPPAALPVSVEWAAAAAKAAVSPPPPPPSPPSEFFLNCLSGAIDAVRPHCCRPRQYCSALFFQTTVTVATPDL